MPADLMKLGRRVAPLSFAQERLWFIDAATPGSATYNVPLLLWWTEPVDIGALRFALTAVAERHEVLRTTYRLQDGAPEQVIGDAAQVPVDTVDLTDVPDARDQAQRHAEALAREPFDLVGQPPVRVMVWQGIPGGDAMLLCVHHIAIDGWSLSALFEDLAQEYEAALTGQSPQRPELPVQYADFAVWDRAMFAAPSMARRVADRVAELQTVPADLALSGRRARVGTPQHTRPGARCVVDLPAPVWLRVKELAKTLRATPFVVLFAAFQVVLQRWSGRAEFLVGTVTANRPHPDLERLVGFFVNTVPLRCAPRPESSFSQLCLQVREEAFNALAHQRIPFDQLVAAWPAEGRGTVGNIGFALQNMPTPTLPGQQRWTTPVLLPTGTAKFDLILLLEDGPDGLEGIVEYDTDCYSAGFARQLGENFRVLLRAATEDPERVLPDLPITERPPDLPAPGVLAGARRDLVSERLRALGAPAGRGAR